MADIPLVRALRDAVRVPGAPAPYDTLHLAVRHPALPATTQVERMSGMLPADPAGAPYPVVVVLPGVNVGSDAYRWLAVRLAEAGMVAVTFDWVGELFPGQYGLTPGVDIARVGPDSYGSGPTTPALAAVLDRLAEHQQAGPLAGLLDLDRVGVFGHSAGGTVALQSTSPDWFPQVAAVASYGGHLMASEQLGFAPRTLLHSPTVAPVLLVAGDADGVVRASAVRYGVEPGDPEHDPVLRTYDEALGASKEAWLAILAGAGHMLPMDPDDPTSARGFLEEPAGGDPDHLRAVLGDLLVDFYRAALAGDATAATALADRLTHPPHEYADLRRR